MPRSVTQRTPEKQRAALLAKLALGFSVAAAARAAGCARGTYYGWRDEVEGFAEAADQAIEQGTDRLEDEAMRRAVHESDTLLIFLLKARRPKKYRDTFKLQHSGPNGEPLTITHIAVVPQSVPPEAINAGDD